MAANQARKSAPTRLKMRSRAGMIYTAAMQETCQERVSNTSKTAPDRDEAC